MKPAARASFQTQHDDLVHDVAYDHYGKRLATCGADRKIKVWELDEASGQWQLGAEWVAHSGAVFRVAWAHPEFGQLLASGSYDRTASVWEEVDELPGKPKWTKQRDLVDSRGEVTDVRFAPRHLGLKLATCSADGLVRLYEAADVMDLSHWALQDEFEARGAKCLAFNPSPFSPPMLLVGYAAAAPPEAPGARVWEYSEGARRWQAAEGGALVGHAGDVNDVAWAPPMGRSFHLLASAGRDGSVRIWRLDLPRPAAAAAASAFSSSSSSAAPGPGSAAAAPASTGAASATAGGSAASGSGSGTGAATGAGPMRVREVAKLEQHGAEVWRVEWNVTGTVLASSGDDGFVRLWRANFRGEFLPLGDPLPAAEDDAAAE